MTAYLKRYYPVQFMAALLSAEDKEEKVANYISVAERMGIDIRVPDINLSEKYFTPNDNSILYGLAGVKGIGETSIPEIIANRPYTSLADIMDKVPKKSFNKRVGLALIKAGAMDCFNENRYNLINQFYELRKDKDERLDEDAYDETACIEFEKEVLGAPVTYKPWWNTIEPGTKVTQPMELVSVAEKTDRNGRLMAFLTLKYKGSTIKGVIFASHYRKYVGLLDTKRYTHAVITGEKDDKGNIIVSKVTEYKQEIDKTEERFHRILA